ncbi:MAG: PqqD family protein [Oscillospiraceae bacterium]|nr:PqqD family protein [Oscillospiraceae bacterium]
MKRYRTRPGVVLTTIAGQNVLVAAKTVRDQCPYTAQINETAAFCWQVLEQGADLDELVRRLSEEYEGADPEQMRADMEQLLAQLCESNYLIEEP